MLSCAVLSRKRSSPADSAHQVQYDMCLLQTPSCMDDSACKDLTTVLTLEAAEYASKSYMLRHSRMSDLAHGLPTTAPQAITHTL